MERKNESYENMNVDLSQTENNVHFKSCGDETYNEYLDKLIENGTVSLRGLKPDATVFDEMILDVNTDYFFQRGSYEFAKQFYEDAFHFAEKIYGEENIVSAVMHADEINSAMSEKYGKPIYHYHLHIMALPVVDKEIKWSKRCKDKNLVGTVKEVIHQVSHSKKWKSAKMLDENGKPVLNSKGKPIYHSSYSILQDEFYEYMTNAGYEGFSRGERGSTAEHLSSIEYKTEKEKNRLKEVETKIKTEVIYNEHKREFSMTEEEIMKIGKKNITGKYTLEEDRYEKLIQLAHDGNILKSEVLNLRKENKYLKDKIWDLQSRINRLQKQLDNLQEKCSGFLKALEIAPKKVKEFINDILTKFKEQQKSIFYEHTEKKSTDKSKNIER